MQSDRTLVKASLGGDGRAFSKLVKRYQYRVLGICLGYTRDFDAAEDAAQEALVSAFLRLASLKDPQAFGPWLRQMAVNGALMWIRQNRRQVSLDEAGEADLASPAPSPEARMAQSDARGEVMSAIGRLTKPQQESLTLFYLEEMSINDIARFLEVSAQAVNQRLYRARQCLKEEMLEMVKETLSKHQMPPDFTHQVVSEILARGEKQLADGAWTSAQEEFRKVTASMPGHVDAQRGLALSLEGELRGRIRDGSVTDDTLVRETFESLGKAYELGATDEALIRRLARLYSSFGRNREGGQFLERVVASRTDWREKIRYLKTAISVYYHSHYREGEDTKADCVRCHRQARDMVPQDLGPRLKLNVWTPAGMALAYPHQGFANEVLSEMDDLEAAIGDDGSIWEYYQMALIRANTFRELERYDRMAEAARTFVVKVAAWFEDDPRLFRPWVSLNESGVERDQTGPCVRFHTWAFMLGVLAQAGSEQGNDVTGIFEELDRVLAAHEAYVRDLQDQADRQAVDEATRKMAGEYTRAGESAARTKCYERALGYFDREEELAGRLEIHGPVYRAAALSALGRAEEAKQQLASISGRLVASGQWRTMFEQLDAFDAIRNDPDVVAIIDTWRKTEAAGRGELH